MEIAEGSELREGRMEDLAIGDFAIIDNKLCIITERRFRQRRKGLREHFLITGGDIFDCSVHTQKIYPPFIIALPIVKVEEFSILTFNESSLLLLSQSGSSREDIAPPNGDFGKKVMEMMGKCGDIRVTVATFRGESTIIKAQICDSADESSAENIVKIF